MMKYACVILCLVKSVTAVCNTCRNGYQFVLPSTVTLTPPVNTNSRFDQCNSMRGVYQCTYHPLFDCDPNIIHHYYTWSTNGFQRITTQFLTPIRMVYVMMFAPSTTMFTIAQIKISVIESNMVQVEQTIKTFRGVYINSGQIFTMSFSADVFGMNIDIITSSKIIMRIVFCATQVTVPQATSTTSPSLPIMSPSLSTMSPSLSTMSPSLSTKSSSPPSVSSSLSTKSPFMSLSLSTMSLSTSNMSPSLSAMSPFMSSAMLPLPTNMLSSLFSPSSSLMALTSTPSSSVNLRPSSSVQVITRSASTTGWIISVTIVTTLLVVVLLLLIIMIIMYCKKLSVITNLTTGPSRDTAELTNYYEVGRYPYPHLLIRTSTCEDNTTLQHNPSYGGAQPNRRRQLNDTYDYVVTDGEMIETDHNPSYVTTTVGSNQLQDNPAYKPAFVAVV